MEHRDDVILLDIVVPGYPHPLERARFARGHTHDTSDNERAKQTIQLFARWNLKPHEGPVSVRITCDYVRRNPTADVDNLAKTVLDACNKYILKDDSQVMRLTVRKRGGMPLDQTRIVIFRLENQ